MQVLTSQDQFQEMLGRVDEQKKRGLIWVLWPSFLVAGVAEGVFFSLFDPADLTFYGDPVSLSRTAIYSIGFFLFWAFAAASSALTCFLQKSPYHINKFCPLDAPERPAGCPKRDDSAGCCD